MVLVRAGTVEDIPRGEGRCFTIQDRRIAIFHLEDGSFGAVDHDCPHRGGPLSDGIVGRDSVICPLHGWRIDLRTGVVIGQEGKSVKTYPVRIEQGEILLKVQG
ncbi:MAG: nitrite reductase small subunit NirD [Nitrospirae bacterium]|nr:nitrite reductase small subunit NirD [Nitrospirota bacterium]